MTKCLMIFAILLSLIVPCYGVQWLKQSTAVTVKIGPFLDDTDGKTAETGLTISQADVRLSKNGGNYVQKTDANSCPPDELGEYDCLLDTTDTGTLGRLRLMVQESGALPVWHEYQIVPANVWDSYFSTDYLQVDTVQVEGSDATDMFDDPNVWYVATIGNDSSGGNRRSDALLTIGQAVTNAQSGDKIIIAPGTYSEQVDCQTPEKSLHFVGINKSDTVITSSEASTVLAFANDEFHNLTIKNTSAAGKAFVSDLPAVGIRIENCWIEGPQAMQIWECRHTIIRNSTIKGSIIAASLKRSHGVVFDTCRILCFTDTAVDCIAINDPASADTSYKNRHTTAIYRNCLIEAYRNDNNNKNVYVARLGGEHIFDNCHIAGFITKTDVGDETPTSEGDIFGIYIDDGTYAGKAIIRGGSVRIKNTGSGGGSEYVLRNGGGTIVVSGCNYDITKTSGTIVQEGIGWAAGVNAEADTALSDCSVLADILEDSDELQTDDIPGKILSAIEEITHLTGLTWEGLRE